MLLISRGKLTRDDRRNYVQVLEIESLKLFPEKKLKYLLNDVAELSNKWIDDSKNI